MVTATPTHADDITSTSAPAHLAGNDPDHDIDAKKTLIVLVVSAAFVFGTVFLLYILFTAIMRDQRESKVEQAPTVKLDELRAWEADMLKAGDEPKRKSLEASIQELSTK